MFKLKSITVALCVTSYGFLTISTDLGLLYSAHVALKLKSFEWIGLIMGLPFICNFAFSLTFPGIASLNTLRWYYVIGLATHCLSMLCIGILDSMQKDKIYVILSAVSMALIGIGYTICSLTIFPIGSCILNYEGAKNDVTAVLQIAFVVGHLVSGSIICISVEVFDFATVYYILGAIQVGLIVLIACSFGITSTSFDSGPTSYLQKCKPHLFQSLQFLLLPEAFILAITTAYLATFQTFISISLAMNLTATLKLNECYIGAYVMASSLGLLMAPLISAYFLRIGCLAKLTIAILVTHIFAIFTFQFATLLTNIIFEVSLFSATLFLCSFCTGAMTNCLSTFFKEIAINRNLFDYVMNGTEIFTVNTNFALFLGNTVGAFAVFMSVFSLFGHQIFINCLFISSACLLLIFVFIVWLTGYFDQLNAILL